MKNILNEMIIEEIINLNFFMPEDSQQLLKRHISEVSFQKNHILMHADRIENNIYFIKKGLVRAFSVINDSEVSFWFGREGEAILSMKSYLHREKGYESIQLLEDCDFYKINSEVLKGLFKEDINIANWGRILSEEELIKTEERFISRISMNATERYLQLLKQTPDLLLRVQLGHIASYLGITQVSLSRIRAEIR
ncbi:Crp/Fnr family transcriptional regulator [Chryseobacterium sp. T1]